jgi:hypothetical protein
MVDMEILNTSATGMSQSSWVLLFIPAILIWNRYPKAERWNRIIFCSFVLLVSYFNLSGSDLSRRRRRWGSLDAEQLVGHPGVDQLGVFNLLYGFFLFRKNLPAMIGILVLFIAL